MCLILQQNVQLFQKWFGLVYDFGLWSKDPSRDCLMAPNQSSLVLLQDGLFHQKTKSATVSQVVWFGLVFDYGLWSKPVRIGLFHQKFSPTKCATVSQVHTLNPFRNCFLLLSARSRPHNMAFTRGLHPGRLKSYQVLQVFKPIQQQQNPKTEHIWPCFNTNQ